MPMRWASMTALRSIASRSVNDPARASITSDENPPTVKAGSVKLEPRVAVTCAQAASKSTGIIKNAVFIL
jgi:hypothetical protein